MKRLAMTMGAMILASELMTMPRQQDIEEISVANLSSLLPVEHILCKAPRKKVREFTYEEAQALMRTAVAEAGNQGVWGMILVMAVILNRVAGEEWPDNILDVINQDGQFKTIENGTYYEVEISLDAHEALAYIEKGGLFDTEIIGFEATSDGKVLEKYFHYAYTVGGHDFYVRKPEGANEM